MPLGTVVSWRGEYNKISRQSECGSNALRLCPPTQSLGTSSAFSLKVVFLMRTWCRPNCEWCNAIYKCPEISYRKSQRRGFDFLSARFLLRQTSRICRVQPISSAPACIIMLLKSTIPNWRSLIVSSWRLFDATGNKNLIRNQTPGAVAISHSHF